MLYKYVAALCLLPASFVVFASARDWLQAAWRGHTYFFALVAKRAPHMVTGTEKNWRAFLLRYPMKLGLEILRHKSVKPALVLCMSKAKRSILGSSPSLSPSQDLPKEPLQPLSLSAMLALLHNPQIQVVSFDIFDTLLARPVIEPKDIFYLVAAAVDKVHNVDFIRLRWDAEAELGKRNATIEDIYAFIQKKHNIAPDIAAALMQEEIHCEEQVLRPRPDIVALYDEAVRLGKRIIAVSDMYLPASILHGIVQRKGYTTMQKTYVSCDYAKRKSDGSLYDLVLAEEQCAAEHILHVGDNYVSDYEQAVGKGLVALHYPAVVEQALRGEAAHLLQVMGEQSKDQAFWRIVLGHALHRVYDKADDAATALPQLEDMAHYTEIVLAPLLTAFCLSIANDSTLQQSYKRLYFASRDGYLPHKIYAEVAKYVNCVPGKYFYAGRRAYYPFLYTNFFAYLASRDRVDHPELFTLHDFLLAHFSDSPLLATLEAGLTQEEKQLLFMPQKDRIVACLQPFAANIEAHLEESRRHARSYYESVFDAREDRHLVFDLGYSGSVGRALQAILGRTTDKIYFWEMAENREADKELGSHTKVFMKHLPLSAITLLLEEMLSPCEGGVLGFDKNGQPHFEDISFSPQHETAAAMVLTHCQDFAADFCDRLGPYVTAFSLNTADMITAANTALLNHPQQRNLALFRHIVFPDPLYHSHPLSLEKKMEERMDWPTVFAGTGFDSIKEVPSLSPQQALEAIPSLRLGLHIHIHNALYCQEIVRYLQTFPLPFDLFVTLSNAQAMSMASGYFTKGLLPKVQQITLLHTPNRGRDVAPWLLGMRPWQGAYDLFGHIHAKSSGHFPFGEDWRLYLFDNILRPEAVLNTVRHFAANPRLGCLFPRLFPSLRQHMTRESITPMGVDGEYAQMQELLGRMGLTPELHRSELFFSAGTMLWYRPKALQQLFNFELAVGEFPEEPIGVGGTLAHALERLPAVVAQRNGYEAYTHTPF